MSVNTHDTQNENTGRNPEADLALIRSMMQAGRQRMGVDGIHLILWGAILMTAFALQYLSATNVIPRTVLGIWVPAYGIGFIISYFINKRNPRKKIENNLTLKVYAAAWNATGISIGLYFFTSLIADTFNPQVITLLTTVCFGSAFYVNSVITGLHKLKFVAAGWWALTVFFAVFYEDAQANTLLILSAASLFLLLIPGHLLKSMLHDKD